MKTTSMITSVKKTLLAAAIGVMVGLTGNVSAQTLLLQLQAANFNPSTGLWTATVGPNASAQTGTGTLVTGATPNGSSVVNFNGSFVLQLGTVIPAGTSYTAFAYVKPTGSTYSALFGGGGSGAFEYRISNINKQDSVRQAQADLGSSSTALSTSAFSLIDVTVSGSGGGYRLNGVSDGNTSGSSFTSYIQTIGSNQGGTGGETFNGQIAEIDIYSGVLTSGQISTVEAALTAAYVSTGPTIVVGLATASPTNVYAGTPVTLNAPVAGATNTTTYQWQTDNGSSGASFANIGGATTTNYVLDTTGLLGNYEYQLIAIGGNSSTSAPVNLTVLAASAPLLVTNSATPSAITNYVGFNQTFAASFTGTLPLAYQWQMSTNANGSGAASLTGNTNITLVLTNLQFTNSGYYSLQATNNVTPYVSNSPWMQLVVAPLSQVVLPAPVLQLMAVNYSTNGVWADSSGNGNNATYTGGTKPALASGATPNGFPAVNIASGGSSFLLVSPLSQTNGGYTVFAYIMPSSVTGGSRYALVGGSSPGGLEYNFYQGHQNYLVEYTGGGGAGTATISTSAFSLIDVAVNSAGGSFKLNGAADGTVPGATFTQPITRIGNNEGGGDGLVGQVAEIDVYNGALSSAQISVVEAQLTGKYVATNAIIIGVATVSPTNIVNAGSPVTLAASVFATNTLTYQWQTDNGSGGTSFSNLGGATTNTYVLNTTGLGGTNEYQLIASAGGNSVTSAPVTLTVLPGSPPVFVSMSGNPALVTNYAGNSQSYTASFTGTLPLAYQWQMSTNATGSNAVSLTGNTNTTLILNNLQLTNSGYYSLQASNNFAPYVSNSPWMQLVVAPASQVALPAPLLQLQALNFNPGTGLWAATVGPNAATQTGSGTLVTGATPNGYPVVNFNGSFVLQLATVIPAGASYTAFVYCKPAGSGNSEAFFGGGGAGAFEYRLNGGFKQDCVRQAQADLGSSSTALSTSAFSLIDVTVSGSGGGYRLNGLADGNTSGSSFTSFIQTIGSNQGGTGGETFSGQIAEIDIYSNVLSSAQISAIEASMTAAYVDPATNVLVSFATVSPTNMVYAGTPVTLSAVTFGATNYQWQTDNGSGGVSFSNLGGATTNVYVLDTTALTGTIEYQLIASAGANSATSAPVTLTVLPAPPLSGPYSTNVLALNPAAYWPFNETNDPSSGTLAVYDASPNHHNGLYLPTAYNAFNGIYGPQPADGYSQFNIGQGALSPYANLANSWAIVPGLNLNTNTVTMIMWLNPAGPQADYTGLLLDRNSGTQAGIRYVTGQQLGYVWNNNDPGTTNYLGGPVIPTGLWSMVAVVVTPTNTSFYVINTNGVSTSTYVYANTNMSWGGSTGPDPLIRIGSDNAVSQTFNGTIDEVSVFNYSLSSNQVVSLSGLVPPVTASTNALLASLSITPPGILDPTFASGTMGYMATNTYVNSLVTVTASSVDANATLQFSFNGGGYGAAVTNNLTSGSSTLVLPTNTVAVQVVSQDLSQTNVYTVNVLLQPSQTVPKLTNSVSGNNLVLSWPADHLGYRLLVQTNNLAKGVSSNTNDWGTVAGSQSITATNITIIKTGVTNEYYRLVYP